MIEGWNQVFFDGQGFWYPPRHSKVADLAKCGMYEIEMTAYLTGILTRNMIFFDIGAHYGYYTLLAAKRAKRVIAFEPRAKTRRVLEANIRGNSHDNVVVVPYPLFRENVRGRMVLSQFREDPSGDIFAYSLDGLNLGIPDVMKLDVEGGECDVLLGALQILKVQKTRVAVELHDSKKLKDYGRHPECLREILLGLGYTMREIGRHSGATFLVAEPGNE